jgi:hypothetical protein
MPRFWIGVIPLADQTVIPIEASWGSDAVGRAGAMECLGSVLAEFLTALQK